MKLNRDQGVIYIPLRGDYTPLKEYHTPLLLNSNTLPKGGCLTADLSTSENSCNRILNSSRCRLTPLHVNQLMQLAIEGPGIPDARNSSNEERAKFDAFFVDAYKLWLKSPHRCK